MALGEKSHQWSECACHTTDLPGEVIPLLQQQHNSCAGNQPLFHWIQDLIHRRKLMSDTVNLVNSPWLGGHKERTYYYYLAKWSCCPSAFYISVFVPTDWCCFIPYSEKLLLQWAETFKWSASSGSSTSPPLKVQEPQQKSKKEFKNQRMGKSVYNVLQRI